MSACFSLTLVQQSAMEVIRAARSPISRFALSQAMGRDRGFGYRMAERLAERGHVRITEHGIVAVELRPVAGLADHSPPPTVRTLRRHISVAIPIGRFRPALTGLTFLMARSSRS